MIDLQIIDNDEGILRFIDDSSLNIRVDHDEIKALIAVERDKPFIVVLRYELREQQTAEYIALLNAASPDSKIILVAPELTDREVIDCLVSGAQGYLQFADLARFLNKAVKVIRQGEAWVSRRIISLMLEKLQHPEKKVQFG